MPFLEKTRRDLSWSLVLEVLGADCFNDHAKARLLLAMPLSDRAEVEEQQQLVSEALRLAEISEALPMQRFEALGELLDSVARGTVASGRELRAVAQLLNVAELLAQHLLRHANECPTLKRRFFTDPELLALKRTIVRAIDEDGEILDAASEALASARRALLRTRRDLKSQQQSLLNKYSEALSGQFFAERDGRYVLPVRSDAPVRVDGFVMGSSGSGSTLYVEPKELTELCNRLRIDEARVHQEEEKVLRELTSKLVQQLPELRHATNVCTEADVLRSVAAWAERHHAQPVRFAANAELHLKAFRHPLLLAGSNAVVANDISLRAGECLILSGPNAGGKTVAMKCLGLAVWMARAGFPLPCREESVVGWFDDVFSDIGDEQSLSHSLSTFSAHITNIAAALQAVGPRSLVLLDELASGTDPDEGAALAAAMLQAFVTAGAAVCVTTHYERLKQLGASSDERFMNGSVGFDVERLKPTFRLALGVPGASAAFAVAERYGVPSAVVEAARDLLPRMQLEQQRVIEQLETERQRLSLAREVSETEAQAATRLREQMQRDRERAFEQERQRLQRQAAELTQEVKQARSLLQQAKKALTESRPEKDLLREVEAWVSKAAGPVALDGALSQALEPKRDDGAVPELAKLVPGAAVYVPHLKAQGEVVDAPQKGSVRVSVGGLKVLVPIDKLRLPTAGSAKKSQKETPRKVKAQPSASSQSANAPMRTSLNTCDLRGVRVEAGVEQVDVFIDQMLRLGEPAAFILHGHGTGAMRSAVREHLSGSSYVSHFEPAPHDDGGDAFTLFWLSG